MSSSLRVDLHSHTTASDGAFAPRDLVRLAAEAKVDVLAVTDHDCVDAVEECLDEGKLRGVRVLPGIELSSRFEERDVHVLGYGFDWRAPELRKRLSGVHERRRRRVDEICAKLGALGVRLDPADVLAEAKGKSVGRKHVARALVKQGRVGSQDEAFGRWLGTGSPANVPVHELPPQDAARLVEAHGGLAVLAHPGFLDDPALAARVLDAAPSIRGIEVWHRYRSATRHRPFLELARQRMLLATGGSDFHGDGHPNNGGLGDFLTPAADWKDLEMRLPAQ